ncbi:MAG: glycosyltransferase family 2 protein [Cellvibrio sp.]|uniref:glycosyltransferase family 2 protein n=1 Tax=Cellvibrio sp. TaxID=1965322 RepID=UPI002717B419|nr:glycosyltransferase family 2 protein [Cellvibrio sp.]
MSSQITENSPVNDASGKPLVTFALFAYNQEKYIRDAVNAAFAQTYEPLEIILSDDCSSDRTFEILREMANAYHGSKTVIVRQTEKNSGTLIHLVNVAKIARGELIVLAAGDDISLNNRTEKLVEIWKSSQAWGLFSRFDRISDSGLVISRSDEVKILTSPRYRLRQYFLTRQDEIKIIHGATSAYDRRIFYFLDTTPNDYILSEDGTLSVLLNLLNKEIRMLDDSLVLYRESEQSLTNGKRSRTVTFETTRSDEIAIARFTRSQANRCDLFLRMNEKFGKQSNVRLDISAIQADREKQTICSRWHSLTIKGKLVYLFRIRNVEELKWCIPRMLPEPIFICVKTLLKSLVYKLERMCVRINRPR